MKRLLHNTQVLTIPNIMSMFRIALLPVIAWLYIGRNDIPSAIMLLIISGISDIADGYIARKYNMVSDFGKVLDPIADKLTQGILLICLAVKYNIIFWLVGIFAVKEFLMFALGYLVFKRKDSVNSAKWYGKANTVIIYFTIVILIIMPDIPQIAVNAIIFTCMFTLLASFALYIKFYMNLLKKNSQN